MSSKLYYRLGLDLDICGDFWGEYLMSFDGLKKTNPKWRTN